MMDKRISIIGLGMIGGSLAMALKRCAACDMEIVGYARRVETAQEALRLGAVDRVVDTLRDAVEGAAIVVLTTPVVAMQELFKEIRKHLAPGTIVTDVGSTKVDVQRWAKLHLGPNVTFIGGHPMAGSAAAGIGGAKPDLFDDTVFCVVVEEATPEPARAALKQLVEWIGARPLVMTAEQHDQYVAGVSHLPVVLASALVTAAATHEQWPSMSQLAAQGFREMTRMAAGSAEVRRSLCSTNQQAIADWIDRYIQILHDYRTHILQDDSGLLDLFENARLARRHWVETRYKRESP